MSDRKIIAVVGATGAQGGGLARAILADPAAGFSVRALTRDPSSAEARALAAAGAEVVQADIDDQASLTAALEGVHGAYFATFFWAHLSPATEKEEARNMATAARDAGVHHVIWSTFEDTRHWVPLHDTRMPTRLGHYKAAAIDAKGESDQVFRELGVPTTFLRTSFHWENLIHFGMNPRLGFDGNLVLTLPMGDARLAGIAAEDIGRCAFGIFKAGSQYVGQYVGIAGEQLTVSEMAAKLSDALGYKVVYRAICPEVYRAIGLPASDDWSSVFRFMRDFEHDVCAARSVELSRQLNPSLQSFDDWLALNVKQIPINVVAY